MEPKDVSILIVENSVGGRNLAVRMLTSLGYKTVTAKNATEALDLITQGRWFDVLFTDIVMPGDMDGIELAHAARMLTPTLKILFTSGFAIMPPEEVEALDGSFVGKPYRRIEIADILIRMLKSH